MVKQGKWDEYRGIMSPIVTPMHDDESINVDALATVVENQLQRGVEGFYCCGSSNEGPLLSLEERQRILRTLVGHVNGKVPVISHVGAVRTADVVYLAQHAELDGADAVSLVPPYYYKFSKAEIIAYYQKCFLRSQYRSLSTTFPNLPRWNSMRILPARY